MDFAPLAPTYSLGAGQQRSKAASYTFQTSSKVPSVEFGQLAPSPKALAKLFYVVGRDERSRAPISTVGFMECTILTQATKFKLRILSGF